LILFECVQLACKCGDPPGPDPLQALASGWVLGLLHARCLADHREHLSAFASDTVAGTRFASRRRRLVGTPGKTGPRASQTDAGIQWVLRTCGTDRTRRGQMPTVRLCIGSDEAEPSVV